MTSVSDNWQVAELSYTVAIIIDVVTDWVK